MLSMRRLPQGHYLPSAVGAPERKHGSTPKKKKKSFAFIFYVSSFAFTFTLDNLIQWDGI
jgi:hypothetical protein